MANIPIALNITPQIPQGKAITLTVQQPPQQTQPPQFAAYQTAEVAGVVTTVNFSQRRGDPTTFRIHCPNSGKSYDAVCDLFCPIRQGDTIYALCMIGPDAKLYVSKPPFVQPAIDRDSMIQCFMRSLRQGYVPAMKLYSMVSKIAGSDEGVIPFLTGIAQSWNDTHNAEILFMFNGIESDDVKKLLNWWHRERNLRRLYLFGLTKKEINACRMTCDDIYQRCMTNPYTVPAIPIDKCDGILDRLNKRPVHEDKIRGAVIRTIWKNLHESGWTGTPTRFLSKQFPGIKDHVEALKRDYDMVAEMETAYLRFPHRVETAIADYIVNKRLNDYIEYDTPIDERIVRDDGKIIHRLGAHFTRELSEDQQRAVQGALDHSLCIVTGAAGVGKCVIMGTPILMFDGSIKKIEDIKAGEQVMGPDSRPRNVLSKCSGTDDMWEVVPEKGRSYMFNTPHVLTLRGSVPNLTTNNVVIFSEKGMKKSEQFSSIDKATQFINQLKDDIFDIPLNEYLTWPTSRQNNCYVFHVPIGFPSHDVTFNANDLGYVIGNYLTRGEIVDKDMVMKLGIIKESTITHIPEIYKINSAHVRYNLLYGVMENRTHINKEYTEITTKSSYSQLLKDIEYIANSLGYIAICGENYLRIYGWGHGVPHGHQIRHLYSEPVPSVKRTVRIGYPSLRYQKFTVVPKGKGIYCGFELDGDGRFLLGDFLVTHNTTCISQIIHNLELRGTTYAICSFTGKAVARIREVTKKRNPSTMHRLISNTRKNQLDKKSTQFEKDIPLMEYEHVIIDEVSMVTTELLYDFIQAYPNIQRLTLVGDVNQLPPIGWGSLFQQILKSETIPVYKLSTNYRVYTADGERDGVILNANAIVSHDPLYPFEFVQTSNFSIIEGPIERVYDIIRGCFSAGIKADQLVIISPYNRCLDQLNRTFQDIYNMGARSITDSRGIKWMIKDRVMLTENDQTIGVFNGESGTILDITDKAILVDFGFSGCHEFLLEPTHEGRANYEQGTTAPYYRRGRIAEEALDGDEGDIDDERTVKRLKHSYALTGDKAQGSEFDFVIIYIDEFNTGSFLNKNRIYTMITRTKRCCWCVVSDIEAFNITAVKPPSYRCENLTRRISERLPNLKPFTILRPDNVLQMLNDLPIMPEDYIPQDAMDNGFDCDDFD